MKSGGSSSLTTPKRKILLDVSSTAKIARLKQRMDPIDHAFRAEVEKRRLNNRVELVRIRQEGKLAYIRERRNDVAIGIATILTIIVVFAFPGPAYLLLTLVWLRTAVQLQRGTSKQNA